MGILSTISRLFVVDDAPEKRGIIQTKGASIADIIAGFSSNPSRSGANVNEESALGISAVWRAVNILAETIAALPFNVHRKSKGISQVYEDHPVDFLISEEPAELYTSYTFRHTMMVHCLLWGNAYAVIRRDATTGKPERLIIIEPDRVQAFLDERDRLFYKIEDINQTFPAGDMIHISNTSWNGLAGLNVLSIQRESLGLAIANQDYGSAFYANGAHLSGVLKHPGRLTQDAYKRLKTSWMTSYGGSSNSGGTAILEEGMDYSPIGLNPVDAAFADTKKLTIADVARIFGVPQFLLEDLDRATFNNIEHLSLLFEKHTLRPWCKRIEAEFNRKLFSRSERRRYRVVFDIDDLRMSDIESRAKMIETQMKYGIINRDEARELIGRNPIKDGSGEKFFVPLNMADPNDLDAANTEADDTG